MRNKKTNIVAAELASVQTPAVVAISNRHTKSVAAISNRYPKSVAAISNRHPNSVAAISNRHPKSVVAISNRHPKSVAAISNRHPKSVAEISNRHPKSVAAISNRHPNSVAAISNRHPNSVAAISNRHPNSVAAISNRHPKSVAAISDCQINVGATLAVACTEAGKVDPFGVGSVCGDLVSIKSHTPSACVRNILMIITLITLILTGCGQKNSDQHANMEAIHREQGVPVVVQEIELSEFTVELEYQTTVHGLRETRVYAGITDQVENINARIGQVVSQNEVIIRFPQDNARASYFQAQAAFQLAEQTLQRMRNLFESGGVSQQELDGAETQFRVAEANYDAVQQAVHVRAPIAGTITDISVRPLERVNSGQYLFTISQLNRLHARIWISPNDINSIPQNAKAIFRWNGYTLEGNIASIGLTLVPEQNAFTADIELENINQRVRGGITGLASIIIYKNESAISVPRNIVQRDADGQTFVFVSENNTAVRKNVSIGKQSELSFEIVDGLEVGDLLIVQGLQLVRAGTKLNVQNNTTIVSVPITNPHCTEASSDTTKEV
ncbi:MAG: efflux RND transporter periplasmic adaptor subunit [Candidatus Cloacimonetes bacterium]|nr:efflux RND transporter periplasmic adaptor subunit [Candidatus Cloacimonadota bacterium]